MRKWGNPKLPVHRLGQIDVLTGFKVRVDVDEHYISRIYSGLKGKFTFADSNYDLKIFKVYTQVTAGHFQVDMSFVRTGSQRNPSWSDPADTAGP